MTTTTRRAVLGAALLAPTAASFARRARAAEPFKVGFVYVGPVSDAGWTFQHELGRRAVDAAYGDKVKTTFVESVPEGADAERVIRQLATDGHELIFTTSFGYMNPTIKVASQFPKVKFEHATGYKRAANVSTYSARFYEGRYIVGVLAGRTSKSGVIGYVPAFPIPEVLQGVNALMLGARSVNPKFEAKVVWTSSWFDPGKERAAADTLIGQGADIVTNHTDSSAVIQAAEEKGAFSLGYDSDMRKFGPKTNLTSVLTNWNDYYIARVKAAMDGSWTSTDTWGGIKEGMIQIAPFNPSVPEAVVAEVKTVQAKIADGSLKPFTGPIKDQTGKDRVAGGQSLADKDILEMNWFVEGVQGKV